MRNIIILFSLSLLLAACSGPKEVALSNTTQSPCTKRTELSKSSDFKGETVNNLAIYQQGSTVFASMDVRTRCEGEITFTLQKEKEQIKLLLKNDNEKMGNCACIKSVKTSLKNLESGTYELMVLNSGGNRLLATRKFNVK